MSHVAIRGARENNLRDVDLDLPLGQLVVFTGVSGSGKSSLAFDTLHAEGRRRYLEAMSLRVRGAAGGLTRPDVDAIEGLPPTIALEQVGPPPSRRLTVGTTTEVDAILRVVFARAGVQMCPGCGEPLRPRTHDEIVAAIAALPDGARLTVEAPLRPSDPGAVLREVARAGFSRVRLDGELTRVEDVRDASGVVELAIVVDRIRLAADRRDRLHDAVRTASRAGRGVVVARHDGGELTFVDRPYCLACDRLMPELTPGLFSPYGAGACPTCAGAGEVEGAACGDCGGSGLREDARHVRWQDRTLPDLQDHTVEALVAWLDGLADDPVTRAAVEAMRERLVVLLRVGVGHLTLGRTTAQLSTGEWQRVRLARQVGARLSGVLYVLDEPTAGLGAGEVTAVVELLRALRDQGNTLVVVEHHRDVVRAADRVIDFGPGAGEAGGDVVFEGALAELLAADTATARWLSGREQLPTREPVAARGAVIVEGLRWRGLDLDRVELPIGGWAAVVGPSGAGKSSLLEAVREHVRAVLGTGSPPPVTSISGLGAFERVAKVERAPMGRGRGSTPATFSGLWDVLRPLLAATREAQVRGMDASFFSLNVKGGRCEACLGTGERRVELHVLPDVFLPCDVCGGSRFSADVLQVRWKGYDPAELLDMRVHEARAVLAGHPRMERILRGLDEVGLGYLPLGQPGHTLSGGEAQRLRLARELSRASGEGTLFVLDDPTTGLHPADVAVLAGLLGQLVADGATVWMATHDPSLARLADVTVALEAGRVAS